MNGILIVDKPEGITSHDVIWQVRKILRQKSVGHTGTLDPFATGVLVVLLGQATRLAQFLDKAEKEYLATVGFGFETDTGDCTGTPKSEVRSPKSEILSSEIESVLEKFRGEIWQTPPMYSAKKIAGKKLYELARQGIEIERQPVKISISKLELVDNVEESEIQNPKSEILLRVICSAGTYIRVLAENIGRELGSAAHLLELRRTRAGAFDLSQAVTLGALQNLAEENQVKNILISPNAALAHLPVVILDQSAIGKTMNGMKHFASSDFQHNQFVRMNDERENLIALGVFDKIEKTIQPRVVLATNEKS